MIKKLIVGMFMGLSLALASDPEPEPMTDGKIVGISLTTDQAQIQGSEWAYPRIEYFDLKNFASAMIVDYENYKSTVLNFSQRTGITPEVSQIAAEIDARGKKVIAEMMKLSGRAMEKRYIDAQVELHERTLGTIDHVFMVHAKHPELRNLVSAIRPAIAGRMEWALRIQYQYSQLSTRAQDPCFNLRNEATR